MHHMKPHFPTLIRRLEKRGMTGVEISRQVDASSQQVNRTNSWDQMPVYPLGHVLVELAAISLYPESTDN